MLAGLGFGPAFSAVFRSLAPLAPPDKRAGRLASIFIVVHLAFGLPALIAGVAVTHFGLRDTTYGYGIMVMALAAMTALAIWRRRARSATAVKLNSMQHMIDRWQPEPERAKSLCEKEVIEAKQAGDVMNSTKGATD